jgi:hypothetical protein
MTYISGPITGLKNHNKPAFDKAIEQLGRDNCISPFDITTIEPAKTWLDYMKADIKVLMDCDSIYMLEGWEYSKGAKLELTIAEELGYKVTFQ